MSDGTDQITVECPHCGHKFKTHSVGDIAGCEKCRERFQRFTHIVQSDTDTDHPDGGDP
jgi:predicted  nucleic acid-binding Zn-ribbon protein